MRPSSSQIDLWPSLGLEIDWDILFNSSKSGEDFHPPDAALTAIGACYNESDHGFGGPLATCIAPHAPTSDIHNVFNTSLQQVGISPRCEFNGGELIGFGVQMATQDNVADVREDAARAYYYPVMDRQNLVVMVNTTGTRILWSQDSSNGNAVAAAVEVSSQNGDILTVYADHEVILSSGAIRSPVLLENSGVGNPTILSQYSINVKINLTAVGENLQDQTTMGISAVSLQNFTGFPVFVAHASLHDLFGSETSSFYDAEVAKLPEYAATIASQNNGASTAAVQEQLLKTQLDLLLNSNTPASEIVPAVIGNFIGGAFWPLQPLSRGSVHINSTNLTARPVIDAKFLQLDFDRTMAVATAKYVRRFLMTEPVNSLINASTLNPSFETVPQDASDDVWLEWITTNASINPNYHHLGTCAMLPRAMGGVVDNDFKVYGTENVRVVDLSVIPLQVAGHSTALLYGVAEWASQKIKAGCWKFNRL